MEELQTGQYVGLVFCIIGLLPFIQYFHEFHYLKKGQFLSFNIFKLSKIKIFLSPVLYFNNSL